MDNHWAIMALATVVALVLLVSELLPMLAETRDTLDRWNFTQAKRSERERGGY